MAISGDYSYPGGCNIEHLPMRIRLTRGGFLLAQHIVFELEVRGDLRFGRVALRLESPFGLWEIAREISEETAVRCFPNFAEITRYALMAVDNRLSLGLACCANVVAAGVGFFAIA
jgi:uncharacterized protein (DUF58 family)